MRSLSVRLLLSFLTLVLVPAALAHDVTLTGTTSFASLDGSSSDHDGAVNGVFTVNDGNLVVNGVVNCNDDSSESACSMAFNVSGNLSVNAGGALHAENRSGSGTGGAITLTVGGNLALNGNAIVSSASKGSSGGTGGAITANVSGSVTLASGSTIDSGSANARGGAITIAAGGVVSVDGNVLSGPSRTFLATRLHGGAALDGGTSNSIGGAITISSATFAEPAVTFGSTANVVSQGGDGGSGPVTIDGCGIQIRGLIAALSRKDGAASVRIRSGKDVLIDGRDLGGSGTRMGRVRADAPTGTALSKGVDIFAAETIDIFGPPSGLFVVTSLPGLHDSKSYGGTIRITSLGGAVNASGNVIDDGHTASGDTGGSVEISAKEDVNLDTAVIRAVGDFNTNNPNRGGGSIRVRSYSGDVIWTNGTGEVRPVGSSSNLPLADQGSIVLTACGTVGTTGSTFPVMGTATSVFPETHTGVCSPAAPSLPAGVPPLITCNTPPVANDASATTNEDTTVTITLSATDADGDPLTFSIVSGPSNGVLSPIVPTGPTSATVDYTPNADYFGGDSFVFQVDDGNGGTDEATVTITVASVNDAPSFLAGPTVTVLEDSGPQTYPNWASSISAGPANESGQTVTFTVTTDEPELFAVQPAVDSNGTLTFTPAANAFGSAGITVTAHDDGGTANGGVDTSAPQTSTINIIAVNDAPSFVSGGDVTVNEDSGPYSAAWATAISAGPANESGQTVTFFASNDTPALFSVQPAISASGVLTFTPAPNAFGTATVSVYAQDNGGTANGGVDTSGTVIFDIVINSVNDPPMAGNDAWETEGNTELRVDLAPGSFPFVGDTTPSGTGVLHNDADPIEGDPLTITGIVGCADGTAPYDCAVTGGTVSLNSNGTFSFQPAPGATAGSFQYTITDGADTATGTVTITIHDMIWYVNGSAPAGGNGTSASPFNSFASLTGMGDIDNPGDYIFVHTSTVNDSLALETSQKLWGQGVGLIIPRNLNGNGFPTTIVAPGARPHLNATGTTVKVMGATGVEIAGLNLSSATGNGIEVTSPLFGGAASASIYSNEVLAAALEGIDINGFSPAGLTVSIDTTSVTSNGNGVDVLGSDGTIVFGYSNGTITSVSGNGLVINGSTADTLIVNGLSNVTISGNTAGDGISITAAHFDANAATAAYETVTGGAMNVGAAGNPVGGAAVTMTNVSGDLAFGSFSAHGSTTGITIAGSGLFTGVAGMQVTSGGGAVSAAAGAGLTLTNTSIGAANLAFTSISATGGANGIVLNNTGTAGGLKVLGTGTAGSGGTIANTTGDGISLTSTTSPAFNWMSIQNTVGSGVKGTEVTNFTFADGSITSSGTGLGVDESNIAFNTTTAGTESNLSGAVLIVRNLLTNAYYHGVDIFNYSGTLADVTISDNTITSMTSTATSKGSGIRLIAFGSATTAADVTKASIANNVIINFPSGAGIVAQGGNANSAGAASTFGVAGNPAAIVSIVGNQIAGNVAARMGTNAISSSVNGKGQGNFDISNNGTAANPLTNIAGNVIANSALGQVTVTARIANNVISANHVAGLGGPLGISSGAAQTFAITDAPQYTVEISGNSVSNTDGNGILAAARSSNAVMKARVLNNMVAAPLSGFRPGIRVDSGTATGNTNVCLEISGNTSAGAGGSLGIGLRKQGTNPTVNMFGVVGMAATSSPGVEAYVDSNNPAGGGTQLLSATSGFSNCTIP